MDKHTTNVAFFIEKKHRITETGAKIPREVVAVFVDYHDKAGCLYECYAHIGQHAVCATEFIAEECKPASKRQYTPLLRELRNMVGYNAVAVHGEVKGRALRWEAIPQVAASKGKVKGNYKNGKVA